MKDNNTIRAMFHNELATGHDQEGPETVRNNGRSGFRGGFYPFGSNRNAFGNFGTMTAVT
jgi:hypothetical protein